ncbi:MAG: polysaccharide biosynthesis protein [Bacteroides sp.]|nr:polysaccharide biosynthesis protein [Bacteroides sp.]MCM1085213.1 polysaccharide biosynthesis protein [Bacteroides sp.]
MPRLFGNSLSKRIAGIPYMNRWFVLTFDLLVSCFCTVGSYIAICSLFAQPVLRETSLLVGCFSLLSGAIGFLLFKTYKNIIRHSSFQSIWRIAAAVITKMVFVMAAYLITRTFPATSQLLAALLLDALLSFCILVSARLVVVLFYTYTLNGFTKSQQKVLLYSANPNDITLSNLLNLNTQSNYTIGGFLSFDSKKATYSIGTLPIFVVEKNSTLRKIVDKEEIQGILFMSQKDILKERNRLIPYCLSKKLKMFTIPPIGKWQHHAPQLRSLDISDLLGRDEININTTKIEQDFKDKAVLVTGAAGSIGSELCRQIATFRIQKLVLLDNCETGLHNLRLELEEKFPNLQLGVVIGDVRSNDRLKFVFEKHHPQIVFHAAAYKHVPLMEENPNEAFMVNSIGTRNIAHMSLHYGVEKFLMVSTDKAVNPTNVMGASKRLAEIYVQSLNQAVKNGLLPGNTRYITTRFGNVLGSQGSVIPLFKSQIEKGGPVTVTHPEITRYFMTIKEACLLMLEASVIGNGGDILVFDMGTPVKIADLAKKMILLSGHEESDVKIEYTGLRPGEKLYEEVLSSEESTHPTSHEKIRIAEAESYGFNELQPLYDRLEEATRACRSEETVQIAKEIVPEYISNNSEFSKFDRK